MRAVMCGAETLFAREKEAFVAVDVKSSGRIGEACEESLRALVRQGRTLSQYLCAVSRLQRIAQRPTGQRWWSG
jgi:hypothetical protein